MELTSHRGGLFGSELRSQRIQGGLTTFQHQTDQSHGQLSHLLPGVTRACPPQKEFMLVASMENGESEHVTEGEFDPKAALVNANFLEQNNNYYCYY